MHIHRAKGRKWLVRNIFYYFDDSKGCCAKYDKNTILVVYQGSVSFPTDLCFLLDESKISIIFDIYARFNDKCATHPY